MLSSTCKPITSTSSSTDITKEVKEESDSLEIRQSKSSPNLPAILSNYQNSRTMSPLNEKKPTDHVIHHHQQQVLPFLDTLPIYDEFGSSLRRVNSLNLKESSKKLNKNKYNLKVNLSNSHQEIRFDENDEKDKSSRYSAPVLTAPAPQHLAISLLQLGCPLVSMPRPRSVVGADQLPASSDSDDSYSTSPPHHHHHQNQGHGVPKVQISAPTNGLESSVVESAGSIGARSVPTTPVQANPPCGQQIHQEKLQLTVNHVPPTRSPSHTALQKSNDSQLSKPLSRSTPSMTVGGGGQTPTAVSRSSSRSSPTSTNSGRQKKFHRHFSQVTPDERVLNYYSCALVGDILLQGHLYITPNYFAFYSNVFGYITKLLIPTTSVLKISKEKTARIIPNAIAIVTQNERHVFCSLLSRDSTYKLMKQVWDSALEGSQTQDNLPVPVQVKIITPEVLLVDDSEVNPEEDDSSMSESGTDNNTRPTTACTDTDALTPTLPRQTLILPRLESKNTHEEKLGIIKSLFRYKLKSGTIIAILVAILAALYILAALMMVRIDKLHTAYLNHPLVSSEKFTHDRLMHYLNSNLDQIIRVRRSLQTLSQHFVAMNQDSETPRTAASSGGGGGSATTFNVMNDGAINPDPPS